MGCLAKAKSSFVVVVFVTFVVLTSVAGAVLGCEPLDQREGVQVKCITPRSAGASKSTVVDCHDRGRRIPAGTVASYGCEEPYYKERVDQRGVGQRTMTCSSDGIWSDGGLEAFHRHKCVLNCGVPHLGSLSSYIIDGTLTKQDEWPWHATLFKRLKSNSTEFHYICGGTLIKPAAATEFLILTASHCLEVAGRTGVPRHVDDVRVVLGSNSPRLNELSPRTTVGTDAQLFKVKEILLHESYDGWRSVFQSDIALIRLSGRVRLAPNVLPACLSDTVGRPSVGGEGHLAGFGYYKIGGHVSSQTLRRATLPVVHPDNCSAWRPTRKLSVQEFCSGTDGGQNACNGDSGGGLVFNGTDSSGQSRFYVQGVVSHGRSAIDEGPSSSGCDKYSVFTKVSSYLDWIAEIVDGINEAVVTPAPVPSSTTTTTTTRTTSFVSMKPKLTSTPTSMRPKTPAAVPAQTGRPPAAAPSALSCGLIPGTDAHLDIRKPSSQSPGLSTFTFEQNVGVIRDRVEWPWQATILVREGTDGYAYSCTGTLIPSPPGGSKGLVVLTAASCLTESERLSPRPADDFQVMLGLLNQLTEGMQSHSPQAGVYKVKTLVIHPGYNQSSASGLITYDHDIALMQLEGTTANTIPACLPSASTPNSRISSYPSIGAIGHVANFRAGQFEGSGPGPVASRLTRTSFPVVEPKRCSKKLEPHEALMFCAGSSSLVNNACHGRRGGGFLLGRGVSGGPSLESSTAGTATRFYVEGVVSRGGQTSGWSAALACRFGVFTRVAAYVDWIHETLSRFM